MKTHCFSWEDTQLKRSTLGMLKSKFRKSTSMQISGHFRRLKESSYVLEKMVWQLVELIKLRIASLLLEGLITFSWSVLSCTMKTVSRELRRSLIMTTVRRYIHTIRTSLQLILLCILSEEESLEEGKKNISRYTVQICVCTYCAEKSNC